MKNNVVINKPDPAQIDLLSAKVACGKNDRKEGMEKN
jgi:hypothetical protein